MNRFGKDKGPAAQTPEIPPRSSPQELDDPTTHSINKQDPPATTATQNPGVLRGVMQKVNPFKSTPQSQIPKAASSESLDQGRAPDSNQNPGVFKGVIQKVNPFKSTAQVAKNESTNDSEEAKENEKKTQVKQVPTDHTAAASTEALDAEIQPQTKPNPGVISGMVQKVNPFKSSQPKDPHPPHSDLSCSDGNLSNNNTLPDKQNPGMFKGMIQKVNPFKSSSSQMPSGECQTDSAAPKPLSVQMKDVQSVHSDTSSSCGSLVDDTVERHSVWCTDAISKTEVQSRPEETDTKRTMSFRLKRILPSPLFGSGTQETVEVQNLEFAGMSSDGTVLDPLDDEDGLLSWWQTVEGWGKWNESTQDQEAEEVVEQAADRVYMAARLFVRLFNKRGASLQRRILELLSLADAADTFHKKTVTASVGGGVASVAGSVATITGLILAPFTAGTSLIVTAVGIGVATAGGLTSASANITDTVHSKTDRKKVEKMIQDYQEEIKDIKECLEFLQEGMEMLEEWNFEKYAESISEKHLNQNVKHVMKEGGRAGKALVVNTESLINTVQVLSVAGGAAKAAQVVSITTGVMSGLFLALDVFFLAKDSVELKKGAKTQFAGKIREVCKELQDGLLELNRIKEDLQKTVDGVEVEVEEEQDDEEMLKSDLKKLIKLGE